MGYPAFGQEPETGVSPLRFAPVEMTSAGAMSRRDFGRGRWAWRLGGGESLSWGGGQDYGEGGAVVGALGAGADADVAAVLLD